MDNFWRIVPHREKKSYVTEIANMYLYSSGISFEQNQYIIDSFRSASFLD